MNVLTLSIKQKYFDEILAGKKTHEYREIRPTNAKKYITYLCGGKEYKADEELPEEGEHYTPAYYLQLITNISPISVV